MARNQHRFLALRATAIVVILVGAAAPARAAAARALDEPVVTIGVSVPRLQYRDIANGVIHAVQLATTQANSLATVPGVTFKVRVLDDTILGMHNTLEDVSNAKSFVADPTVIGEIGQISSGAVQATEAIFNNAQMVQISPAEVSPDFTNPAMRAMYEPHSVHTGAPITFFRTISSDAFQGRVAAFYAYRVLNVRSVYVLDNDGTYGKTLANGFRTQIAALGARVIGSDHTDNTQFQLGTPLLADNIMSASGGPPDMVYFGGTVGPNGGAELLANALAARGVPAIFMGGDGIFDNQLITGTHAGSALGAYATSSGPLVSVYPPAQAFLKAEARLYPHVPVSLYDVQAYDAALALVDAYRRALNSGAISVTDRVGPVLRGQIAKQLASTKISGASGTVSFDKNGDIKSHLFSVYKVIAVGNRESWSYAGIAPAS